MASRHDDDPFLKLKNKVEFLHWTSGKGAKNTSERESVQAVASPPVCHRRHEARYHGYPDDLEIQEIVSRNTLAKVQIGVWCRSGLLLTLLSNLNARPLRPKPKRRREKGSVVISFRHSSCQICACYGIYLEFMSPSPRITKGCA